MNKRLYYLFTSEPYVEQIRNPNLAKMTKIKKAIESDYADMEVLLSNKSASLCKAHDLFRDIKSDLDMCEGVIFLKGWNNVEDCQMIFEHCTNYHLPIFVYDNYVLKKIKGGRRIEAKIGNSTINDNNSPIHNNKNNRERYNNEQGAKDN